LEWNLETQIGDLANRDFYALNIFYSIGLLNCVTVGNSDWKPYSIWHNSSAPYFHHKISILGKYLLLVTTKKTDIRLTARLGKSVQTGRSHFDSPYGQACFSCHRLQFTQLSLDYQVILLKTLNSYIFRNLLVRHQEVH